jgi:hypothetical protein
MMVVIMTHLATLIIFAGFQLAAATRSNETSALTGASNASVILRAITSIIDAAPARTNGQSNQAKMPASSTPSTQSGSTILKSVATAIKNPPTEMTTTLHLDRTNADKSTPSSRAILSTSSTSLSVTQPAQSVLLSTVMSVAQSANSLHSNLSDKSIRSTQSSQSTQTPKIVMSTVAANDILLLHKDLVSSSVGKTRQIMCTSDVMSVLGKIGICASTIELEEKCSKKEISISAQDCAAFDGNWCCTAPLSKLIPLHSSDAKLEINSTTDASVKYSSKNDTHENHNDDKKEGGQGEKHENQQEYRKKDQEENHQIEFDDRNWYKRGYQSDHHQKQNSSYDDDRDRYWYKSGYRTTDDDQKRDTSDNLDDDDDWNWYRVGYENDDYQQRNKSKHDRNEDGQEQHGDNHDQQEEKTDEHEEHHRREYSPKKDRYNSHEDVADDNLRKSNNSKEDSKAENDEKQDGEYSDGDRKEHEKEQDDDDQKGYKKRRHGEDDHKEDEKEQDDDDQKGYNKRRHGEDDHKKDKKEHGDD